MVRACGGARSGDTSRRPMSAKPHIVQVHDVIGGPTGMGIVAEAMGRAVLDRGWQLTLVASEITGQTPPGVHHRVAWPTRLPSIPAHVVWCARAARRMRQLDGDLVHVHSPFLMGLADVMTCHHMAQPAFAHGLRETGGMARRGQSWANRQLDDRLYRHRRREIHLSFVSGFLRDEFRRHYGEPRGGWVLRPPAPPWQPVGEEERLVARRRWAVAYAGLAVGYMGGDDARKGIDHVRELTGVPDFSLLLAGPGSERVTWDAGRGLGFVNSEELLNACDVLLVPSVFDAAPVAVLQAIARGVPVVLTEAVGYADLIERHGAGVVWDRRRPLVEAVREAASASSESCRRLREELDETILHSRLIAAYDQVLDSTRTAGGSGGRDSR